MSDPVRIAIVAGGKTDIALLAAAVKATLPGRALVLRALEPELSVDFKRVHTGLGEGWSAVYRWCQQAVDQAGGPLRDNPLFLNVDVLVVQLDADVADSSYASANIKDAATDLPCRKDCPPPSATTNALRAVLLRWMAEADTPRSVVVCTPSKALEAWVLAGLYPEDRFVRDGRLECRDSPVLLLQSKPQEGRFVRGGKKQVDVYIGRAEEFGAAWPRVRVTCTEAERFANDLVAAALAP